MLSTGTLQAVRWALVGCSLLGAGALAACSKAPEPGEKKTSGEVEQAALVSSGSARNPAACRACEESNLCSYFVSICDKFEGNAKEGPKAGTPKRKLCEELVACVERTNCAKTHVSECYCGKAEGTECLEGKARGECLAELEAALETKDAAALAVRFDQDEQWTGARVMTKYKCQHERCEAACFPR